MVWNISEYVEPDSVFGTNGVWSAVSRTIAVFTTAERQ